MPITIRPERPNDAPAIRDVTREAFRTAPHTDGTEHLIVDALRDAGALALSLVAEEHGELVGHVALSAVSIGDGTTPGWYGLGPISVAPSRQRQGIGSALMRAAIEALRGVGAAGCVLLGDPDFYARFGFEPAAPLMLPDVPPRFFQALVLADPRASGVVQYHAAFGVGG